MFNLVDEQHPRYDRKIGKKILKKTEKHLKQQAGLFCKHENIPSQDNQNSEILPFLLGGASHIRLHSGREASFCRILPCGLRRHGWRPRCCAHANIAREALPAGQLRKKMSGTEVESGQARSSWTWQCSAVAPQGPNRERSRHHCVSFLIFYPFSLTTVCVNLA